VSFNRLVLCLLAGQSLSSRMYRESRRRALIAVKAWNVRLSRKSAVNTIIFVLSTSMSVWRWWRPTAVVSSVISAITVVTCTDSPAIAIVSIRRAYNKILVNFQIHTIIFIMPTTSPIFKVWLHNCLYLHNASEH
jgi:hypothetical protein